MNLTDFNLNLLKTFDSVYRHRSVSAAAEELNLTQPAVTSALNKLRAHFDNPLFVRTSHSMHPTPLATDLAPKVTRVLDAVRTLDVPTEFVPKAARDHFNIFVHDVGLIAVMPRIIHQISQEAPNVQLTVVDLRPDEVIDAVDAGKVDMAFGYFFGVPNWARQKHLRTTSYICAVRKDHPEIGDTISLAQYLSAKHATYWAGGSAYVQLDAALAKRGHVRDIAVRVPRLAALPFVVAATDLVITIPEDLGLLFRDLVPIKLLPAPLSLENFQIKQYWHERMHADPAHKWLRDLVRRQVNEIALKKR